MKPSHRALCVAVLALVVTPAITLAEDNPPETPITNTAQVVPAKANEGPTTLGPLPVVKATSATQDPRDDDAVPTVGADEFENVSLGGTLLKTMLVLGIVVGLIYLSLNFGLRKLMGVRGVSMGRSSLVKVVERIPLDPKRSLFVIHAAGEYLLVGGGDEGLSLLSKLDAAEVERHLAERKQNGGAASPFLQKLLSRASQPPRDPPPSEKV